MIKLFGGFIIGAMIGFMIGVLIAAGDDDK